MITILPLQDSKRVEAVLEDLPDRGDNAAVLVMGDPIDELGYVAVDMKDSVLRMRKMEVFGSNLEQPDLNARVCSDSLMRAAASYGANKGAYRIETEIPGLGTLLKGVGFLPEGKKFVCDLSKIVKICKD
ncbi:hypothetical protein I4000191A8_09690 [Clostridia bacterium i40-0019-1A8]